MEMTPARWDRLRAVFDELTDLPEADQAIRLEEYTFGDPEFRQEVEALLLAAREVGQRFEKPASMGDTMAPPSASMLPGTRIGAYQIVREIGKGGMGAVYEATRVDGEFSKRVALKLVPPDRETDALLERFRFERRILARLEHKNIAALLDGGITPDGQPFFAMEFVEGERIDRYCDHHRLGIRARLQLFRQVCAAVQYAHQNLVVHRDLKPGNILVGADGTVKLLDFGIAKLLDPTEAGDQLTQTGMLPMTTAYASPEQLRGEVVSTASDLYSLGVVLYELLAGRPPFADPSLPILEVRRRMLETVPVPPSQAASAETAALFGEGTTARLKRALAGELDNIVLMALRKEPERRYSSAEQLSEDLLRFLAGLPVQAQPDSVGYRLSKFVRRNRLAMGMTVAAVVALVVGTATSLWQARVARAERDRARISTEVANEVTEFFRSVLISAKPNRQGKQVTVLEAIDSVAGAFDTAFAARPAVRAKVAASLGSTFYDLGDYDRALPLLQTAYHLQQSIDSGRVTIEGADAVYNLAGALWSKGRLAQAESLFRRALPMAEQAGESAAEVASGYGQFAALLSDEGHQSEALAMSARVITLLRQDPANRGALAIALQNRAVFLGDGGQYGEAATALREANVRLTEAFGPEDMRVGHSLQPLAFTLMVLHQYREADSVARLSLAKLQAAVGRTDPRTLSALRTIGEIAVEQGKAAEALPLLQEVVAARGHGLVEESPELAAAYALLGRALAQQGRFQDALAAARESRRLRVGVMGADHPLVYASDNVIGDILARMGQHEEAQQVLTSSLAGLERTAGPTHFRTQQARERLARLQSSR